MQRSRIITIFHKRTCESNPQCTCGGQNCGYVAGIAPISIVCMPKNYPFGIQESTGAVFKAKAGAFMMSINEWTENKNSFGTVSSKNTFFILSIISSPLQMPKTVHCYSYSLLHMRLDTILESHMILIKNMVEMVNPIVVVLVKRM